MEGVEERLAEFQGALHEEVAAAVIVQRYVLHGECAALSSGQHFELKRRIAERFAIDPNRDIYVVGSAKLGFSIAPDKRYVQFHEKSDIDVAIVSHDLHQNVWHMVHEYDESGGFWPKRPQFVKKAAWGWLRPDLLPATAGFPFTREWFEFFMTLRKSGEFGNIKIAAGIYHDVTFLERYQTQSVNKCRQAS